MCKIVLVCEEETENKYRKIGEMLEDRFTVEKVCIRGNRSSIEYCEIFTASNADYICSLDMAGFQITTMVEYPNYNMMTEKQLHIVIEEESLAKYAENDFALNLFLYVPEDAGPWRERYPYIPNLDSYQRFEMDENGDVQDSDSNRKALNEMIDRVIREANGQV